MTSMTAEIASFDSIIPPSTHCSAGMSCGGVRSKSARGAISAMLTRPAPPFLTVPGPFYRTALTMGSGQCSAAIDWRPVGLCINLWIACADTPFWLWATWGADCGQRPNYPRRTHSSCENSVHLMCTEESLARGKASAAARRVDRRAGPVWITGRPDWLAKTGPLDRLDLVRRLPAAG